jgi:hypothetical protein
MVLCAKLALSFMIGTQLIAAQASNSKAYYKPTAPFRPKSEQECAKLAAEYERLQREISSDHDACRQDQGNAQSSLPGLKPPPSLPSSPKEGRTCSRPACQKLPDMRTNPYFTDVSPQLGGRLPRPRNQGIYSRNIIKEYKDGRLCALAPARSRT